MPVDACRREEGAAQGPLVQQRLEQPVQQQQVVLPRLEQQRRVEQQPQQGQKQPAGVLQGRLGQPAEVLLQPGAAGHATEWQGRN